MEAPYLDRLLDGVPVDPDAPGILYGAGVAIYAETPHGPVYGHGGWIPAYVSSLRHYADHGVTVAFQVNTDVGFLDDSSDLVPALEAALAELAIEAVGDPGAPCWPALAAPRCGRSMGHGRLPRHDGSGRGPHRPAQQRYQTRAGPLEYAVAGRGAPLMMIHGTGGGFDQGLLFAHGLREAGFQIVAPSRFGYLRSASPTTPRRPTRRMFLPSLLDHLGLIGSPWQGARRGADGGRIRPAPSRPLFASRPDRAGGEPDGARSGGIHALQRIAVERVLTSDAWFWGFATLAPTCCCARCWQPIRPCSGGSPPKSVAVPT
jgi:hypothetical protein